MAEIELLEYQYESLQQQAQFLLWHGGRGSGKSHTLVQDLYNCAAQFPGGRFALVCNDLVQLRDSTHACLTDYLDSIGCDFSYKEQKKKLYFPNGSTIQELSFEKDKTSLKGAEWDGVFADEADGKNTTEDKFDYLVDSCRGKTKSLAELQGRPQKEWPVSRRVRVACNPVPPGHFLAKRFFVDRRDSHIGYKVSTYMNSKNLPPDYVKNLEAKYPPGTDDHRRWMLGEMVALRGAIYPEFDATRHIIDVAEVPDLVYFVKGLDLGTRDPNVYLVGGLDRMGKLYIIGEYYSPENTSIQVLNAEIQRLDIALGLHGQGWTIYSDHSATAREGLAFEGTFTELADKEVHRGIDVTRQRIRDDAFFIVSGRAPMLAEEIQLYEWKKGVSGAREHPEHKFSHSVDALRYLCMGVDGNRNGANDWQDVANQW